MATDHCVFDYRYRDAGNYKISQSILLKGNVEDSDQDAIVSKLESGEFFIPEQVGLPPLQQGLKIYSAMPNADDHVWHEFVALRTASESDLEATQATRAKADLLESFSKIVQWDERLSSIHVDLAKRVGGIDAAAHDTSYL